MTLLNLFILKRSYDFAFFQILPKTFEYFIEYTNHLKINTKNYRNLFAINNRNHNALKRLKKNII
jgi:hypothetical protein